ncbi:uncharacterized protein STEHIDRAFT_114253 [Stereum hirsutum FP-91666 SS1]|uniref:uncharacterized protein n=1 Tax=Stereum hirsutum (strain FP-91666) TaxID=721885 RepID=UPI000444A779|nr:uncharacterized protein STEHIDRAFT_114253 [Stereum hirsutum FP-91666 SS1]EIM82315.1 hypothetical protein STEHIDRAFT_114253 [Stereum hirsutum FP-91666 SS1]
MRNKWKGGGRFFIGEVLDLYTKGSGRHCSVDTVDKASDLSYLSLRVYLPLSLSQGVYDDDSDSEDSEDEPPEFSCHYRSFELHTHGKGSSLLYNLGPHIFKTLDADPLRSVLKPVVASRWRGEHSRSRW